MTRVDNISLSSSHSPDRLAYMAQKFCDWKEKGRIPHDSGLQEAWERSRPIYVNRAYLQAIAWVLGVNDIGKVAVRQTRITDNFGLTFICVDGRVVDLCTHRTLRSINRIYLHWIERKPIRRDEAEMLRRMSITKFMSWQQGGLIRGKLTPRISGKCKLGVKR